MIRVRSAFIYLTERCNLDCRYCYFRHKKQAELSRETVFRFLKALAEANAVPMAFELSGGEPLLCWELFVETARMIRRQFPSSSIGVQTNGLLLTPAKAAFLKQYRFNVEIGIDGAEAVTARWRRGMGPAGFKRLVGNIEACVARGLPVDCTMTVHPREAMRLKAGFLFLRHLGIRNIDITPAAFMPWTPQAVRVFKAEYTQVMGLARVGDLHGEEERVMGKDEVDLSLHPPGHVLGGDVFLCLPPGLKKKESLWDLATGKINEGKALNMARSMRVLMGRVKEAHHRAYVCAGFRMINRMAGREFVNTRQMIPLMRFLAKAHSLMNAKNTAESTSGQG
ncbi:MAG: radical SAM protein [Candidatus Omnitrophica bacterium]|nr:radical SAM protein [Candidatus Omnitrophota bacterium]